MRTNPVINGHINKNVNTVTTSNRTVSERSRLFNSYSVSEVGNSNYTLDMAQLTSAEQSYFVDTRV